MKFNSNHALAYSSTPLGRVLLASTPEGLAGVWFEGQRHVPDLGQIHPLAAPPSGNLLAVASQQISEYFQGQRQAFDLPLDLSCGTDFQQLVWHTLLDITQGQTVSYGQLAMQVGRPKASRAVGAAVGRNPISLLVPCHRVVGANGQLTGYAGGLERKRALLQLESAV